MNKTINEHTVLNNADNVPYITFNSFKDVKWLNCGFSTRYGGVSRGCFSSMNMSFMRGDDPKDVMENIRLFSASAGFKPENIVMPHQCHTTNVETVGDKDKGRGVQLSLLRNENGAVLSDIPGTEEEIDGQITNRPDVVLYVLGADCVPVFIVDTEKRVVSAVHAGWKGTVNDIAGAAIEKMKSEFGTCLKDIKAVIGPSICQDCYEVSEDVADVFIKKYYVASDSFYDLNLRGTDIVRPASGDFKDNPTGKYYLNLWEANRVNLIKAGVPESNIEISGLCTRCHPDMFFSHRAHGNDRGVNIGFITIRG